MAGLDPAIQRHPGDLATCPWTTASAGGHDRSSGLRHGHTYLLWQQHFLHQLGALVLALIAFFGAANAGERRHGLSSFGDLKYPSDFTHFDYVNPDAPKGGRLALVGVSAVLTFNHFNPFILKGDAAEGAEDLLFDSLMRRAYDEPDAMYGLIAEAAEVADDKMSVTFFLRPQARFRDGSPVTAQDVVFSFNLLKEKGHPRFRNALGDVVEAKAIDAHTVTFRFKGEAVRDLPLIVASLPVLSKAYYDDPAHDFSKESFEPPMGSGPYDLGDFRQGSFVTYKRRPDYWGADLPVNRGRYNFDEVRYDYYRDRAVSLEAFKAHAYDLREEFTAKSWAFEYNFPAVASGQVKKLTLPDKTPSGAQGFFLNTRRPQLADVRVRKALGYAFDFEWMNKVLFAGAYTRTASYFENTDLKAQGLPSPEELALLEPYRDRLPAEVFGGAIEPPKTDGSGRSRANMVAATKLLEEAGFRLQGGRRVNAKGEVLTVEFLIDDPLTERILGPYAAKLSELGIEVIQKRVDPAQEQLRLKTYDFDIVGQRFVIPLTPGPQIRNFWTSAAAKEDGSYNLSGIADPVVDALVEKVIAAKSRDELRTACRALDRVLRAGYYWVPNWYKPVHTIATWDLFGAPKKQPLYDRGIVDTWWYDQQKAEKLAKK